MRGKFEFEVALYQLSGTVKKQQRFILRDIFNNLGIMDKLEVTQENELYQIAQSGSCTVRVKS